MAVGGPINRTRYALTMAHPAQAKPTSSVEQLCIATCTPTGYNSLSPSTKHMAVRPRPVVPNAYL